MITPVYRLRRTALLWSLLPAFCVWAAVASLHAAPDLTTPEVRALAEEYRQAHEAQASNLRVQRDVLLREALDKAQAELRRARVAGNIPGQAAWRNAVQIIEAARASLANTGAFSLPDRVRRDLETTFTDLRNRDAAIVATASNTTLSKQYRSRLAEILEHQGTLPVDHEQLPTLWEQVVAPEEPAPDAERHETEIAPKEEETTDAAHEAPEPTAVIATSGESAEWVRLGVVKAEVSALEVLSFPLPGRHDPVSIDSHGPVSQRPFTGTYTPERLFREHEGQTAYRAWSIPGFAPLDIVRWPDARNRWSLEVRVRPRGDLPSLHAVRIEVDRAVADNWPLLSHATPESGENDILPGNAPTTVRRRIESDPAGAAVFLDNKMLTRGGRALLTPCDLDLDTSTRRITLRMRAHLDATIDLTAETIRDNKVLSARLSPDPNFMEETFTIAANARDWTRSPVRVRAGHRVRITAQGRWSCDTRGNPIGPNGYPNDDRYYHYYINPAAHPRQTTDANYGALLVKIGHDGTPQPVGDRLDFAAEHSGFLFFDINDGADNVSRRLNSGALTIHVIAVQPHFQP